MEDVNPAKLFSVEGMVVVITGGATGIGLMMTKAFALNGAAKVYIVGRRKAKLDEAAKLSPHGNIIPLVGDVTSKESLCDVADQVRRDAGFVNLLICNSGIMTPTTVAVKTADVPVHEYAKAALELKTEDWNDAFATNTTSIFFSAVAFLELLDAGNKKGNCAGRQSQILVTSSIAGFLRVPGANLAYGASKAGATLLVKHLSGNFVPYSIRVNAIAPGLFPSDIATGLINDLNSDKKDPTEEGAVDARFIPARRVGKTADIAGVVLFMASAAGAYLNGDINIVDGGRIGVSNGAY